MGILEDFRNFEISFFVAGGFWDGGHRRGFRKYLKQRGWGKVSSGASQGSLHGGASLKAEKAHAGVEKKGLENRKNDERLPYPRCMPPPEAL